MSYLAENLSRKLLFGCWYRNDVNEQGKQIVEYAQMSEDGSFEFSFTSYDEKGTIVEHIIELGDWGLVGDIHFTLTKSEVVKNKMYAADLNDDDNYQAYRVLLLTHQTFKYQHILTDAIYTMHRVVDDIGHC